MNILALDLGKFNTMCCFFHTKTRKHSFLNAATDRNYLASVFKNHDIDLVVMEACGPSGWIKDLAVSLGLKTLVCSTNEEAWRWSNVKRKTDKDDALNSARKPERKLLLPAATQQPSTLRRTTLRRKRPNQVLKRSPTNAPHPKPGIIPNRQRQLNRTHGEQESQYRPADGDAYRFLTSTNEWVYQNEMRLHLE